MDSIESNGWYNLKHEYSISKCENIVWIYIWTEVFTWEKDENIDN